MSGEGVRGFRDSFRSFVPKWLSNRLGRNAGFRLLYSLILPFDVMMEAAIEGVQAAMPGLGTPTALPLIGRSRGILRGETETNAAYAARLRAWLDTWTQAGADEILARQIQAYLGNTPMVRIVDRAGNWTTVASDGTVTRVTGAPMNWDTLSNPERAGYWSDIWIVVYPCEWAVSANLGAGNTLGDHEHGLGHQVGRTAVQAILSLVATWKGAHTYVRAIIWSYDATLFDPANITAAGDPDGWWGNWGKLSGGNMVTARNLTCRYWVPADGG